MGSDPVPFKTNVCYYERKEMTSITQIKTTRLANGLNTFKYFQIYDQCNFNNDKFGNIQKHLS